MVDSSQTDRRRSPLSTDGAKTGTSHKGQETQKRFARLNAAGPCPGDKLRHVNAPVGGFTVVDPTLRLPESFAQVPLRQAGFLPQFPQKAWKSPVRYRVLRLRSH